MEILLVDNICFNAARFSSSGTILKCSVASKNPRIVRGNEGHAEYIKKLMAVAGLFGKEYCIHVKKNPSNATDYNKCMVRLHGFFLQNLERLWMEGLRLRIQLAFSLNAEAGTNSCQFFPLLMCTEIPILKPLEKSLATVDSDLETCIRDGVFLEATDVSVYYWNHLFDETLGYKPNIRGCATITLLSDSDDLHLTENDQLAAFDSLSLGITRTNKVILDSKLHSDVVIFAKDDSEHKCNKNFLAAQSSVLRTMLETDMKESKTAKVEMKNMTSDGVKALLEYLYTFEFDQAFEKCDIALELLETGHTYDIESLEEEVSSLIINKNENWFSVDMAFSLFLFTKEVEPMKEIKMKAASMLMKKPKEFLGCKSYIKERQENPVGAADAVQELFCLAVTQ